MHFKTIIFAFSLVCAFAPASKAYATDPARTDAQLASMRAMIHKGFDKFLEDAYASLENIEDVTARRHQAKDLTWDVQYLIQDFVNNGKGPEVKAFLDSLDDVAKANIDNHIFIFSPRSMLGSAAESCNVEMAQALLNAGADPRKIVRQVAKYDEKGSIVRDAQNLIILQDYTPADLAAQKAEFARSENKNAAKCEETAFLLQKWQLSAELAEAMDKYFEAKKQVETLPETILQLNKRLDDSEALHKTFVTGPGAQVAPEPAKQGIN